MSEPIHPEVLQNSLDAATDRMGIETSSSARAALTEIEDWRAPRQAGLTWADWVISELRARGFEIVPQAPTDAMIRAGNAASLYIAAGVNELQASDASEIWHAMITEALK